jgi:hypothetical protein
MKRSVAWNWAHQSHPRLSRQAPETEWKPLSSLCTTLRAASNPIASQGYQYSLMCIQKFVTIYKWRLLFGIKITIFIGADIEHTCLLIVGGDELAVGLARTSNLKIFTNFYKTWSKSQRCSSWDYRWWPARDVSPVSFVMTYDVNSPPVPLICIVCSWSLNPSRLYIIICAWVKKGGGSSGRKHNE